MKRTWCLVALLPLFAAAPAGGTTPPVIASPRALRAIGAPKAGAARPGSRWTAGDPDAMAAHAAARAKAHGKDALAGLAVLASLFDRASPGLVKRQLLDIGDGKGPIAEQARWIAASLEPDPVRGAPPGLVTHLAILGPFQDTSGRVKEADLDEGSPAAWADRKASYSWGAYEVAWRPVITPVTAHGVPLDLYITPRKESCTYVASRVTLAQGGSIALHLASSGQARLLWDGKTVAVSEEDHEGMLFDRLGGRVDALPGDHLVAARVCSGAPDDGGRVRLRIEAPDGQPVRFESSSDLAPLAGRSFAEAKVSEQPELLTSALELAKKPKARDELRVAVLRTRGQAEDLRSTRAPGLLDDVAHDPHLTPDTLAMAGWISSFGAARSGWLNRARERAEAEGDRETLDFTVRRVAAARVELGFGDWALAALRSEPFASDQDAEAKLIRAHAEADVGGEATRRASLTALMDEVERTHGRVPIAMWEEIARFAHTYDPKGELRARDELARLGPENFDLDRVRAAAAIDADAVVGAAAAAIQQGGVTEADELDGVAQALTSAGRAGAALDFLRVAAGVAPNSASLQQLLAQALFASGKPEDRPRAEQALLRARALDPGDARLRAELAMRTKGAQHAPLGDERFLVPPETFLARAKADPARRGEVADRQLHWVRVVTQHDDRRVSQLIHYSREIVIAPRTQEELYEGIPIEGDDTEILRARVHHPSGEVSFAEEQKSDYGRPMIRWPDLKSGDVVEVAIRSWTSGPIGRRGDPPFYFMDYGGAVSTHPLLYNEVITDLPKEHPLAVDILNGKADRVTSSEEGGRVLTHYIWDKPVSLPDEPLAPKASEIFPTLVVSSFSSWADFRTWYNGAVAGFTVPDEQVIQLAASLTRNAATRDEKLKALFEFVADDIRYVNYISGEWWLPNRPQQLLARRQGDCDDKALLLITLLRAVGIEATEVLLQTRYSGQPSLLLSKKAAIPLFDHGIAYLPAHGAEPAIWLDATSPESRLGPVPSMDTRTFALFATEGPPEMTQTPRGSPDDYGYDATWTLKLSPSGAAELSADELHRGDQAFFLRGALRQKDARAQWVEQNLVAGWIPQVQVDKGVDFEPDLPGGKARVHYQATSNGLGRKEGSDLIVTLAPSSTLTSQLAPLPRRVLPVVLPANLAPSRQSHVVRLIAPEGMKPGELPPGGDAVGGDFGRAHLDIALDPKDPRVVVLTRSVVFDLEKIPVARYEAWRAWLSRVDSLQHRSLRFVPDAAAGGSGSRGAP